MHLPSSKASAVAAILAVVIAALPAFAQRAPVRPGPAPPEIPPAAFGEKFPAWTYTNANDAAAGAAKLDLATVLGKSPIVLYFWAPGNLRSDKVFADLQTLVEKQGPGKLMLFGVVSPLAAVDLATVKTKTREAQVRVPVLWDEGFRLMQQLKIMTTPFVAVIDRAGILRLSNGVSLKQPLEYKMSLEDGIKRVAATGQLGNYGELPRYDPVTELVGKKPPEFELPDVRDGIPRRSASLISSDKLTIYVFWAVDCGHCLKFMPKLNEWFRDHQEGMNVVSLARVTNDAMKTKTAEFAKLNGFAFPTLADKDMTVAQLYQVTATPTIVVMRPDGVLDSVMPSGEENFETYFQAKRKAIFKKS